MSEFFTTAFSQFQQNSMLELAAVILAVAYLLLAVRQHIACWYAALVSTAIFLHVFWQVDLYMESALQVFYLGMAVYGWYQWKYSVAASGAPSSVTTWPLRYHVAAIMVVLVATAVSGTLLKDTGQAMGYIDSFTTWGAVVTTFMVAKKILENWIYWLVIDAVSIYLYLDRELYFTALLFCAYIIIIFFGYTAWLRDYRAGQTRVI